jgi:hypothetical protein
MKTRGREVDKMAKIGYYKVLKILAFFWRFYNHQKKAGKPALSLRQSGEE